MYSESNVVGKHFASFLCSTVVPFCLKLLRGGVKFTSSKDIGKVDNSHGLNL